MNQEAFAKNEFSFTTLMHLYTNKRSRPRKNSHSNLNSQLGIPAKEQSFA